MPPLSTKTTDRPAWVPELNLAPHPEGGWYRRTYAHHTAVAGALLGDSYRGERPLATSILYCLGAGDTSRWHRVRSDELWFHHAGGPLTLWLGRTQFDAPTEPQTVVLGVDLDVGEQPQILVPAGTWQAARADGADVLASCVVAPGFDFEDFTAREDSPVDTHPGRSA